jgi:hypothetical protein
MPGIAHWSSIRSDVPLVAPRLPLRGIADGQHNSHVPGESWKLSRGLRAVTAVYRLIYVGLLYAIMWFFFPRVWLMPVMVTAGVLYAALCFARIRVVLDRAGSKVAITTGLRTRHVRLTQVERVEVRRFGAEIKIAGGETAGFGPSLRRLHRAGCLIRIAPVCGAVPVRPVVPGRLVVRQDRGRSRLRGRQCAL